MINISKDNSRIIVTSGARYIDIDAYASCIVYAKILRKLGMNAYAFSSAILNESIPETIFPINRIEKNYEYNELDKFIVLDVSDLNYFDSIVKADNIIEIIDHHFGFEEYWERKIGDGSIIEPIGSVATIITEYAINTEYIDEMPKEEILLLMSAILDNTLNLKAKITTKRDIEAYNLLLKKVNFVDFDKYYFGECQNYIFKDFGKYIDLDTKYDSGIMLPKYFSQIILYDKNIINDKYQIIADELEKKGDDWIINIIDLKEGKSFIYSTNNTPQEKMEKIFGKKFDNMNLLDLGSLYLRKEIIKFAKKMN